MEFKLEGLGDDREREIVIKKGNGQYLEVATGVRGNQGRIYLTRRNAEVIAGALLAMSQGIERTS